MAAALNEQAVEQSEQNERAALNEQVDPTERADLNDQADPDKQAAPVAQVDLVVSEPQVALNKLAGLEAGHQVAPDEPVGLVVEQDQVLAEN